jgi:Rrf2 family iron-sulfur cluster assembly transcriptional regulator
MKLRSQTLTALRALLDLCVYSAPHVPTSLAEIARRQQLSVAFLEQLFRRLKGAGLVSPFRGMKGGYTLTRAPQAISLLEVFQALQDPLVAPAKSSTQRAEITVLLEALGDAAQALETKLGAMSLEELKRRAIEHPDLKGVPRVGAGFSI